MRAGVLRQARAARARAGVAETETPTPGAPRYNATARGTRAAIEAHLIVQARTWTAVARAAGVAEAWLYQLDRARTPSLEAVQAVASVLQVPPWKLLWPDAPPEDPTALPDAPHIGS